MKYFVTLPSGREHTVEIVEQPGGALSVSVDGEAVPAEAQGNDAGAAVAAGRGATTIRVANHAIELWLEGSPPDVGVIADGRRFFAKVESERMRVKAAAKGGSSSEGVVKSPMPGRVVRVSVAVGDEVAAGVPVVVVEAMKMENELVAPRAGKVKKVHVAAGATVDGGAPLVELE